MSFPGHGATVASRWKLFCIVGFSCITGTIHAQFGSEDDFWDPVIGNPGLSGIGYALAVQGDTLFVTGAFTSAGGASANGIARWDGTNWFSVGGGLSLTPGPPKAVAVLQQTLFVGGLMTNAYATNGANFPVTNVAAWDGTSWSNMRGGVDAAVNALAVSRGYLYAGGLFTNAGGVAARGLAQWDGTNWSSVGGGVNGNVYALAASGDDLYVGGSFTQAGSLTTANIVRWDGTNWQSLAGGVSGFGVTALAVHGNEVFAVRPLSTPFIFRWNGAAWDSPLHPLYNARALAANNYLYLGFQGVLQGVLHWAGCTTPNSPGSGIAQSQTGSNAAVHALACSGTNLYVAGEFTLAGGKPSVGIARWRAANAPRIGIVNQSGTVGSSGTNYLQFPVSVCPAPEEPLAIEYRTTNNTAIAGVHYEAVAGVLIFSNSGPLQQTISVPVYGRPSYFPLRRFNLGLSTTNRILTSVLDAEGAIWSSLPAPTISINDAFVVEGNTGTNLLDFIVSLSAPVDEPLSVALRFQDITAFTNIDYVPIRTKIVVPAGGLAQAFSVPVLPNTIREVDKQFSISLTTNSAFLRTNRGPAIGTILNDDTVPALTPSSTSVFETDLRTTGAAPVRLSAPVEQPVTVDFATMDGTARAGADYIATSGRLVFPPGSTTQHVLVPILGDAYGESNETFHINLFNPINASLMATQVYCTIWSLDRLTLPAGFEASVAATGLAKPTRMEFAPDGRLFVCEQAGNIWVFRDGVRLPGPFLSLGTNTVGASELGLLGLAFDPEFATNQFLYIYYTKLKPGTSSPAINRISRFTANGDTVAPGSEVVLHELDPRAYGIHNGGDVHFGPDGKLYVSVGEHGYDTNSQTLNTRLGKVLRLNKDGSIPTDNPFHAIATGTNRAIWALGLRNPFTFAFQPGTGRMFINDVGSYRWEEINEGVAGANYGWPAVEGATTNAAFRNPIFSYLNPAAAAITGGAFYNPPTAQFPAAYVGNYFYGDYIGGFIRRLTFDNGIESTNFAAGFPSLVDLKVAPDGSLYCLCHEFRDAFNRLLGGRLYRILFPGAPSRFESIAPAAGSFMELRISAATGHSYSLEVSSNLLEWQRFTNVVAPAQAFTIRVPASPPATRFYRLVE